MHFASIRRGALSNATPAWRKRLLNAGIANWRKRSRSLPLIPKRYSVTVTTAADGSATATFPAQSISGNITAMDPPNGAIGGRVGFIHSVIYTKPGSNAYSNSVVVSLVTEKTGITVWSETLATNASETLSPSMPVHDNASTATGSTDYIPLASEGVTITITSGGNAKDGTFTLVVLEPG